MMQWVLVENTLRKSISTVMSCNVILHNIYTVNRIPNDILCCRTQYYSKILCCLHKNYHPIDLSRKLKWTLDTKFHWKISIFDLSNGNVLNEIVLSHIIWRSLDFVRTGKYLEVEHKPAAGFYNSFQLVFSHNSSEFLTSINVTFYNIAI